MTRLRRWLRAAAVPVTAPFQSLCGSASAARSATEVLRPLDRTPAESEGSLSLRLFPYPINPEPRRVVRPAAPFRLPSPSGVASRREESRVQGPRTARPRPGAKYTETRSPLRVEGVDPGASAPPSAVARPAPRRSAPGSLGASLGSLGRRTLRTSASTRRARARLDSTPRPRTEHRL